MLVVNRASLAEAKRAMLAAGFTRLRTIRWRSGIALGGDPSLFRRGRHPIRVDYVVVGTMPGARLRPQRVVSAKPVPVARAGRYPTEKPAALGASLARIAGVKRGDLVVDPYAGSGALLEGAAARGAAVVAGDRSARAVAIARRRLGRKSPAPPAKDRVAPVALGGNVRQRKGRRALGSRPRHR